MISPTGKGIRNDKMGQGHWGASRGNGVHKGVDFQSVAGQEVIAPFDLFIKRISKPNNSYLSGIAFQNLSSKGRIWYFEPNKHLIGKEVKQGVCIGIAQSLKQHYGDNMTDHIHVQFDQFDPMVFIGLASILKMRVT